MLQKCFYTGTVASTVESYRDRCDFGRTLTFLFGGALLVMLTLFSWSVYAVFPLVDTHPALASVIVAIKVAASAVIVATALALVAALRCWRRMAAQLACVRG